MTVYVVPPPNNTGWPEVDFYHELIAAGGEALFPFEELPSGDRNYSVSTWGDLMSQFAAAYLPDDNDRILYCEAFHPAALYVRSLYPMANARPPLQVGLMHGGSFVPGDTLAQELGTEYNLINSYDHTIVCVQYQHDLQRSAYPGIPATVLPYPLHRGVETTPRVEQPHRVGAVFPHRQIPEKGFDLFNQLAVMYPTIPFRSPDKLNKRALFELFGKTQVIFANSEMELFGTAVEEALAMGCIGVLNRHPAYVERYENTEATIVWHDGTEDSANDAMMEALDMREWSTWPYPIGTSASRAKAILDFVEAL